MADSYLGRLQSMFSDPYMQGGGRPVTGGLSPMQQAALGGVRQPLNITPRPGMAEAGRIAPRAGWPSGPNFQTVGGPQQVGGEMRNFRPAAPNFTMPSSSYPAPATMSYPTPATAGPSGLATQGGGNAARFMGAATDVTPRLPAPAAGGGMMRGLLGIGGQLMSLPATAYTLAAPYMVNAAEQSMPGQMLGAMSPDGGLGAYIMDAAQQAAPMPSPQMATNAAPPTPMAQAPTAYPETSGMRYPAPVQRAAPRAPMPMPVPQMQAPAPMPSYAPPGGVWEGQNQGIQDDTRAKAQAWVRQQMGLV